MKTQQKNLLFCLLMSLLMLGIIGYNYWSYRCGYCTISSLMSFSAPAILLLVGIGIATLVLLSVKARNKRLLRQSQCHCGVSLHGQWNYCPSCGQQRKGHRPS